MGDQYLMIMAFAGIIIISFFFNIISKRTKIPSVMLLIGFGIGIKAVFDAYELKGLENLDSLLVVLGNIGLVMIVLEASLDLKWEKEKTGLIIKALIVGAIGIFGTILFLTLFFLYIFPSAGLYEAIVYSIPLSIMSSAIIIPSVGRLAGHKKEFMIYESTFADVIGIMVFYFMIGAEGGAGVSYILVDVILNIVVTLLFAVVVAYGLTYLFQYLQMQVKLFLIIAVLLLLFAVGKYFHLSAILIILTFGVVLTNADVFFQGRLAKYFDREKVKPILTDFRLLTTESTFLVRTFFFVVFGMSITLASLVNWEVAVNSVVIVAILYLVRFLALRFVAREFLFPELFIAPRGLIAVLLFFVIGKTETIDIPAFDAGLLLYPILISSLIMMIALISYKDPTKQRMNENT